MNLFFFLFQKIRETDVSLNINSSFEPDTINLNIKNLNCHIIRLINRPNFRSNQPHFYPVTKEPTTPSQGQPRKRKTKHSQNPPVEMHVGWILDTRADAGARTRDRHDSTRDSISDTQSLSSSYGTPQSLPTFQHPSHALLSENGFTQLQYSKYHSRCLKGMFSS